MKQYALESKLQVQHDSVKEDKASKIGVKIKGHEGMNST